jgi:hypothetical protein
MRIIREPEVRKTGYGYYISREIDPASLPKGDPRLESGRTDAIVEYLHMDGIWRLGTQNFETGQMTGYYKTEAEAQKIMKSY